MINTTLDNRYTIMERIGGGGMAEVYRAHDRLLDRSVAVKVLRSQFTNDEDFVTRFRREAQAAAKLSHPNIVNIYDVGRDQDVYYIVMEYISGETLKERIQRDAPLSVEIAVNFAMEIGEALEHAHQNGLIHCDIKPHNILMTRSGRIKVTDFGIARAVTSATMTQTGTIIGSVHYFSPEQAKGSVVDAKSDIYSLGIVMYEMITGAVPFTGETPISIALKHIQEEPRPPREINPDVPPLIEAIVLKAIAKDQSLRFANVYEMIADLKRAQNFLRDDHTRRIAKEDFPTQILPKIDQPIDGIKTATAKNKGTSETKLSKNWVWAFAFHMLLGFAMGAFMAFGKFWSLNEVVVPNVVGKQLDIARSILDGKNLRVSTVENFNEKVPAGHIISQNPEAGSTVKEQRIITLVASKGGEITVVPDVRNLKRRDAELQIKNTGLIQGRVDEQYSNEFAVDLVISQNPRPPAQVSKGTAIDIVVSKGPLPRRISLPDFRGTPLSTVASQLDSLKLKQGSVNEAPSDKYPPGIIIGQYPAPASEVTEGSSIDLTVSQNLVGASKRAVVQITVPDGPIRQSVQIVVTDINGRRVVYEEVKKPGDKIEKKVEGTGQVRMQVYINGVLLQEQIL